MFCPDVPESSYSPEDILTLLQDVRFKQTIEAKRIQYIILVYARDLSRGWRSKARSDMKGFAIYNQRDTRHSVKTTVIDTENAEIVGAVLADCSASSGYGFGVAFGSSG